MIAVFIQYNVSKWPDTKIYTFWLSGHFINDSDVSTLDSSGFVRVKSSTGAIVKRRRCDICLNPPVELRISNCDDCFDEF